MGSERGPYFHNNYASSEALKLEKRSNRQDGWIVQCYKVRLTKDIRIGSFPVCDALDDWMTIHRFRKLDYFLDYKMGCPRGCHVLNMPYRDG